MSAIQPQILHSMQLVREGAEVDLGALLISTLAHPCLGGLAQPSAYLFALARQPPCTEVNTLVARCGQTQTHIDCYSTGVFIWCNDGGAGFGCVYSGLDLWSAVQCKLQ